MRVHLATWVLDDGAVAPFGLGRAGAGSDHVLLGRAPSTARRYEVLQEQEGRV